MTGWFKQRLGPLLAWLLLALPLALPLSLLAAPPLKFQRLGVDDGLSQSVVGPILQDRQGFLWFGTQDGLNRYDGYGFQIYRYQADIPHSLTSSYISALLQDKSGQLYVGTESGLNRFEMAQGRFVREPLGPGPAPSVTALLEDRTGQLWVGTETGLFRRDDQGRYQRYGFEPDQPGSLSDNRITALLADRLGYVWVGTRDGLNRLEPKSGTVRRYQPQASDPSSLSDGRISALHETPAGELWVGTHNGLNHYRMGEDAFERIYASHDNRGLIDDRIQALTSDGAGRLWVGTAAGIARREASGERYLPVYHRAADPRSLSGDDVLSFYQDRSGLLWIGTYGAGISVWDPASERFAHYLSGHDLGLSPAALRVPAQAVPALSFDRLGRIWAGTINHGLFCLDRGRDTLTEFRHEPGKPDSLPSDSVMAITEDSRGRLWFGTEGGGLARLLPGERGFEHYRSNPGDPASLSDDRVLALHEDRRGQLWVGTGAGLDRLEENGRFRRFGEELPAAYRRIEPRVLTMLDTLDGALWLGGDGGLVRRSPDGKSYRLFQAAPGVDGALSHNAVMSLYEDDSGTLWVGTAAGLNRVHQEGEHIRFEAITERDGLVNGVIYAIEAEASGKLWLSSNQGLQRYSPVSRQIESFRLRDGLQGNEFYATSRARSLDGELLFGGLNGFNAFYPEALTPRRHRPQVMFTALREYKAPGNRFTDLVGRRRVSIDPQTRLFALEFAASDLRDPRANRFQYRLSGLNEDWLMTDGKRELVFSQLPAGTYRLDVRAAGAEGLWSEPPASLELQVQALWWRHPAAMTLWLLVLTLGLLLAAHQLRRRSLAHQRRAREQERAEQARFGALYSEHQQLEQALQECRQSVERHSRDQASLQRALNQLSLSDGLTGLADRRAGLRTLLTLWTGTAAPPALFLLDLDGFAAHNRRVGFELCDSWLVQTAKHLQTLCPPEAKLVRWGGDAFLIVKPDCTLRAAEQLAERLRLGIAMQDYPQPSSPSGREHLSCSIGAVCHPALQGSGQVQLMQALHLAEWALHAAKKTSRNAWVLWGPGAEPPEEMLVADETPERWIAAGWVTPRSSLPRAVRLQF